MSDEPRVLFCGLGTSAVAWYRCILPAQALGADWCGLGYEPPNLQFYTGLVKGETRLPRWEDYDIIVVQQPRGLGWHKLIREMQDRGIRVIFEIDDYVAAMPSFRSVLEDGVITDRELVERSGRVADLVQRLER